MPGAPDPVVAPELVGRADVLAVLDSLAADVRDQLSRVVVLRGPPGIGKTALLDHLATTADDLTVLRAEGAEAESDLPFAALHQLLSPALGHLDAVPTPQAEALETALGLAPGRPDRFLVGLAVLSLLAEAADGTGLLCLVDDVQWVDAESRDVLWFVARRVQGEGIGLVLAARHEGTALPQLTNAVAVDLGPLEPQDARRLLDRAGGGLASGVASRVLEEAGGNPLALRELPTALDEDQRSGRAPLPSALPVGERLRLVFAAQVGRLPTGCQTLLVAAAAEPSADLAVLSRAAQHLGLDLVVLEPAERTGLVAVSHDGVTFRHPLLRAVVYAEAPFLTRRAVHAALAEAVSGTSSDRWAWHRAAMVDGTDPVVADELERSAGRALARGGFSAAAQALERAAELSTDPGHEARRLVASARASWEAGQLDRAVALLARVEPLEATVEVQVGAAHLRGLLEARTGRPAHAVQVLRGAADRAVDAGLPEAAPILVAATEAMALAGDFSQVPQVADAARRLERAGVALPEIQLLLGTDRLLAGDLAAATSRLTAFLGDADRVQDGRGLVWRATAALFLGDEDRADALADRAVSSSRAAGAAGTLAWALEVRAARELTTGHFALAEADAEESRELGLQVRHGEVSVAALSVLASLATVRGRPEAAPLAARAREVGTRRGILLPLAAIAVWEAEVHLARNRPEDALRTYDAVAASSDHPLVVQATVPGRVEAAVRAGLSPDLAALALLEAEAARSSSPAPAALATRCRALLAEPREAEALYGEALRLHRLADRPYDLARTTLALGEVLRRQGRRTDARRLLGEAAEAFGRLGAAPWCERTEVELRAAGVQTPSTPEDPFRSLTPQELQVVRLVSEGLSSRQVADQLFLSPRTVEYHLYKVYPKLGVSSRSELTRRFLEHAGPVASYAAQP